MKYEKIDSLLMRFFQGFVNISGKIKISQITLVNTFLLIQILAQLIQIGFLFYIGKNTLTVFIITLPTWLIVIYFRQLTNTSKKRPVQIEHVRIFSSVFTLIVVCNFIYLSILSRFGMNSFYRVEFVSELTYTISVIAFMCVMYLLSCGSKPPEQKAPNKLPS